MLWRTRERKDIKTREWPLNALLISSHYLLLYGRPMCSIFQWHCEILRSNGKQCKSPVFGALSSPDCKCDKGHSEYKYTRWPWWTQERVGPQPARQNRPDRPTTGWDLFHSGLSEWQCHPLVRGNTTRSLEEVHSAWGEACGSDVIQDDWGQACLSWLQVRRIARLFKGTWMWGWGGVAIIYLRQWHTHTCLQSHTESPVVYMHYVTGKCGTVKMIISMSYIKLLQSQLY